jgi:hypothetical protein
MQGIKEGGAVTDNLRKISVSGNICNVRIGRAEVKGAHRPRTLRMLFILCLFCTIPLSLVSTHRTAYARTVHIDDYCQWVVKKVLVPATYQDVVTCNNDWKVCAFDPSCCVPVVCNALPHCQLLQTTLDVAEHHEDQMAWQCSPADLDAAAELKKWLRQQIPSLDDVLIPGAAEAVKADIQAMKVAAISIPDKVKAQLAGLINPFASAGNAKFSMADVNRARILSNSNSNASLYLRDGYNGITLYDLVILRSDRYDLLRNPKMQNYTLKEILSGKADAAYVKALLLLVHELTHVNQYSSLGLDAFLTNYYLQGAFVGYRSISFEKEAYGFAHAVKMQIAWVKDDSFKFSLSPFQDRGGSGWNNYKTLIGDVNGDGRADIIWNATGDKNRVYVALARPDGTFQVFTPFQDHAGAGWNNYKTLIGDVNGDGRADIIWNSSGNTNRVYVGLGKADGTFQFLPFQDHAGAGWNNYKTLIGDVNGDGRADIIWNSSGNTNRVYVGLGKADGAFQFLPFQDHAGAGWNNYKTLIGDVNGDGRADIIWNDTVNGNNVYVGLASPDGSGTFEFKPGQNCGGTGWNNYKTLIGDVNGDGKTQIIWNETGNSRNRIYVGTLEAD